MKPKIMKFQRIRDLREDRDLNQTQVARILNTTQSYYAQYERGERAIPLERAVILADFYNVSLDYLAGRTNNKKGYENKTQIKQTYNAKNQTVINKIEDKE